NSSGLPQSHPERHRGLATAIRFAKCAGPRRRPSMPYLTSAEFSEIVAVADTIMHHLRTSGWQFVPAPNVGAALTQSRLAKTTITLKAVRQPFHSVQHIEANSGILLDIPNSYYTPSSATPQ